MKYEVFWSYTEKSPRKYQREQWPSTEEENIERLKEAGESMPERRPVCTRCKGRTTFPKTN